MSVQEDRRREPGETELWDGPGGRAGAEPGPAEPRHQQTGGPGRGYHQGQQTFHSQTVAEYREHRTGPSKGSY